MKLDLNSGVAFASFGESGARVIRDKSTDAVGQKRTSKAQNNLINTIFEGQPAKNQRGARL